MALKHDLYTTEAGGTLMATDIAPGYKHDMAGDTNTYDFYVKSYNSLGDVVDSNVNSGWADVSPRLTITGMTPINAGGNSEYAPFQYVGGRMEYTMDSGTTWIEFDSGTIIHAGVDEIRETISGSVKEVRFANGNTSYFWEGNLVMIGGNITTLNIYQNHWLSIDISGLNTAGITSWYKMFVSCFHPSGTFVDMTGCDMTGATDASYMFMYSPTHTINMNGCNTSTIENMSNMFKSCNKVTTLDLSGFDTSSVTSMSNMFNGVSVLDNLDISHFNTSNVEQFEYMFTNLRKLPTLDLTNMDTSKALDMRDMFAGCNIVTDLDLGSFTSPLVTDMQNMFRDVIDNRDLNLSQMTFNNVTNMNYMFYNNKNLTCITNINTTSASKSYMFNYCEDLIQPDGWNSSTSNYTGSIQDLTDANGADWVNPNTCGSFNPITPIIPIINFAASDNLNGEVELTFTEQ